jgi:hypothetical protein
MRATILVPFLGSVILFNAHVVEWLTASPEMLAQWWGVEGATSGAARRFTISRLQYAYLGLTLLGFGAAIFTVFCPSEIKQFSTVREFRVGETVTVAQSLILLDDAAHAFTGGRNQGLRVTYPKNLEMHYRQMLLEIISEIDRGEFLGPQHRGETNFATKRLSALEGHAARLVEAASKLIVGNVNTNTRDELYVAISNGIRNRSVDLLELQYNRLDHSIPWARVFAITAYGLGFIVLLVPTVDTFFRVMLRVVGI